MVCHNRPSKYDSFLHLVLDTWYFLSFLHLALETGYFLIFQKCRPFWNQTKIHNGTTKNFFATLESFLSSEGHTYSHNHCLCLDSSCIFWNCSRFFLSIPRFQKVAIASSWSRHPINKFWVSFNFSQFRNKLAV